MLQRYYELRPWTRVRTAKKNPHIVYDIYLLLRLHIDSLVISVLYVCLWMKAGKNQNQDKLFFQLFIRAHSIAHLLVSFNCVHSVRTFIWNGDAHFKDLTNVNCLLPIRDTLHSVSKWLCSAFILSSIHAWSERLHCTFNFTFHICFFERLNTQIHALARVCTQRTHVHTVVPKNRSKRRNPNI